MKALTLQSVMHQNLKELSLMLKEMVVVSIMKIPNIYCQEHDSEELQAGDMENKHEPDVVEDVDKDQVQVR